jgi:hypothetical protein
MARRPETPSSGVTDFSLARMPLVEHRGRHRPPERRIGRAIKAGIVALLGVALLLIAVAEKQDKPGAIAVVLIVGSAVVCIGALRGRPPKRRRGPPRRRPPKPVESTRTVDATLNQVAAP